MCHSSDWKGNALILLTALGVAALYGGATALVFWILGFSEAVEIGETVSTFTGSLALAVALLTIVFFAPRKEIDQPMSWLERWFVRLAGGAFFILIAIPLGIVTLGRFLYRHIGKPVPKKI